MGEKSQLLKKFKEEDYVPIELTVNLNEGVDKINVLWNNGQDSIGPEYLAKIIVDDHNLSVSAEQDILQQIKDALDSHKKFLFNYDPFTEEKLCTIKLNIEHLGLHLRDCFEWDLFEENNDPLEFSRMLVAELGLPLIFENLISFEIFKQLYNFKKLFNKSDTIYAYDSYIRKKSRGRKNQDLTVFKERIRKGTINKDNCFRRMQYLEEWSPQVYYKPK